MADIKLNETVNRQDSSRIDVLFVTGQARFPEALARVLAMRNLSWKKVGIDEFGPVAENAESIGTVILDTTDVNVAQEKALYATLEELEGQHVSTILLNDTINFRHDKFSLVRSLDSSSIDELLGRIDSNTQYRKVVGRESKLDKPYLAGADIDEQLKMAGQVQRNFLPSDLPDSEQIQWGAVFEPADWVSGDIYDATRLDEQHMAFYIADAVGHSMPAALLTMFLKQAIVMRETKGNDYRIFGPSEVMKELNRRMVEQRLKGCLFATCCYCLLNTRTLQLTFTRGGHPYPILIRKGQKPVPIENRGSLLGVFNDAEFETTTVQLERGDKFVVYSDGAEPVIGNVDDKQEFLFTDAFKSIMNFPVKQMMKELESLVKNEKWQGYGEDDMTAVGLEIL